MTSKNKVLGIFPLGFAFIFFFILSFQSVYPICLTDEQNKTIYALANATNVSATDLKAIFESLCEKQDTGDEKISSLVNTTEGNFSLLGQNITDLNSTLDAFVARQEVEDLKAAMDWEFNKSFNETVLNHLSEFEGEMEGFKEDLYQNISSDKIEYEDIFDEKLYDLREDFITEDMFEEFKQNLTTDMYIKLDQIEKKSRVPQWVTYAFWLCIGGFGLVIAWKFAERKVKIPRRMLKDVKGEKHTVEGLVTSKEIEDKREHLDQMLETFFDHKKIKKLTKASQQELVKRIQDAEIKDKEDLDRQIELTLKLQGLK